MGTLAAAEGAVGDAAGAADVGVWACTEAGAESLVEGVAGIGDCCWANPARLRVSVAASAAVRR